MRATQLKSAEIIKEKPSEIPRAARERHLGGPHKGGP
jgi:hypothetical protein